MTASIPRDLCKQIFAFDKSIRFAGVADRYGTTILTEYRKTSTPLLSKQESALSIIQASIRMGSRKTLQPKLGKIVYAFTFHEKVKRATIPLINDSYLMVSFDVDANHDSIIMKKILPLLTKLDLRGG